MEPTFTNAQIQACLLDVEEEIPRLTTSLIWSKQQASGLSMIDKATI